MDTRKKLILVDDHPMILEGLKAVVSDSYEIVNTFRLASDVIEAVKWKKIDLSKIDAVITDITFFDKSETYNETLFYGKSHYDPSLKPNSAKRITTIEKSGIHLLKYIKKEKTDIKVIIYTKHDEAIYIYEAINANVDAYIYKGSHYNENERFLSFIDCILKGIKTDEHLAKVRIDRIEKELFCSDVIREKVELLINFKKGRKLRENRADYGKLFLDKDIENIFRKYANTCYKHYKETDNLENAFSNIKDELYWGSDKTIKNRLSCISKLIGINIIERTKTPTKDIEKIINLAKDLDLIRDQNMIS